MTYKIGVAIFNNPDQFDPNSSNPGWACIYNKEPFEISGAGDLATDVYWWLNISPRTSANHRLFRTPSLLHSRYFRLDMKSICIELGISEKSRKEKVFMLVNIAHNIFFLASSKYKYSRPPYESLAAGLSQTINLNHNDKDEKLKDYILSSVQTYTQCQIAGYDPNRKFVALVLDRLEHAEYIFSQKLPLGQFSDISDLKIPMPPESDRVKWIIKSDVSAIVECSLNKINPAYNSLINYGSGAGLSSSGGIGNGAVSLNNRRYISLPELKALSLLVGEIDIGRIIVDPSDRSHIYRLPFSSDKYRLSYSAGIFAENLWVSLGKDPSDRRGRTNRLSPITAWIHAMDRMRCLSHAAAAKEAGFQVVSYGYGRVILAVDESETEELIKFSIENHMIPPVGFGKNTKFIITDKKCPTEIRIALGITDQINQILKVDDLLVRKLREHFV